MTSRIPTTRRKAFQTGLSALAAAAVTSCDALTLPKTTGETRVLYLGGDYIHNGVGQELFLRQTFSKSGFHLMFAQASHFITPDVLRKTDLFIMSRLGTHDVLGFSPSGIVGNRPAPDVFLPRETEDALVENVLERGMGFIALHATVRNPHKRKLMALLGIRPHQGSALQAVRFHDFNPVHPITQGFSDFDIAAEENQATDIIDPEVTILFKSLGLYDRRVNNAGWCVERGAGRVVALLAGHSNDALAHPLYRQLHWRAAHWALRRDIPKFDMAG